MPVQQTEQAHRALSFFRFLSSEWLLRDRGEVWKLSAAFCIMHRRTIQRFTGNLQRFLQTEFKHPTGIGLHMLTVNGGGISAQNRPKQTPGWTHRDPKPPSLKWKSHSSGQTQCNSCSSLLAITPGAGKHHLVNEDVRFGSMEWGTQTGELLLLLSLLKAGLGVCPILLATLTLSHPSRGDVFSIQTSPTLQLESPGISIKQLTAHCCNNRTSPQFHEKSTIPWKALGIFPSRSYWYHTKCKLLFVFFFLS